MLGLTQSLSILVHRFISAFPLRRTLPRNSPPSVRERIQLEVVETLGLSSFTLDMPSLKMSDDLLATVWNRLAPYLEASQFEDGANRLFVEASAATQQLQLPRLAVASPNPHLDVEIKTGLDFYQYVLPRVLLAVMLVQKLMPRQPATESITSAELPKSGHDARQCFERLRQILRPTSSRPLGAQLALWKDYVRVGEAYLQPIMGCKSYQRAGDRLRKVATEVAAEISRNPSLMTLDHQGESLARELEQLEQKLPEMILQVSMLAALRSPAASAMSVLSTRIPPLPSRRATPVRRPRAATLVGRPQLATA